jgi:hypothetical protein
MTENGVIGRDAQVASQRQIESAAQAVASHRGNHGASAALDAIHQRLAQL